MNRQAFLQTWFREITKLYPPRPDESYTFENFENSVMVRACSIALGLNRDSLKLDLVTTEENLRSLLEMKSLAFPARNLVRHLLEKNLAMQRGNE